MTKTTITISGVELDPTTLSESERKALHEATKEPPKPKPKVTAWELERSGHNVYLVKLAQHSNTSVELFAHREGSPCNGPLLSSKELIQTAIAMTTAAMELEGVEPWQYTGTSYGLDTDSGWAIGNLRQVLAGLEAGA